MITSPALIYNSEEMNLDLVEQAVHKIIEKGFGAYGPAITAYDLLHRYLGREYAIVGGQEDLSRFALVKPYAYAYGQIILCPAVMEIINKHFKTYRTKHYIYYAPKSTSVRRVRNWLGDDFIGVMENPA